MPANASVTSRTGKSTHLERSTQRQGKRVCKGPCALSLCGLCCSDKFRVSWFSWVADPQDAARILQVPQSAQRLQHKAATTCSRKNTQMTKPTPHGLTISCQHNAHNITSLNPKHVIDTLRWFPGRGLHHDSDWNLQPMECLRLHWEPVCFSSGLGANPVVSVWKGIWINSEKRTMTPTDVATLALVCRRRNKANGKHVHARTHAVLAGDSPKSWAHTPPWHDPNSQFSLKAPPAS